MEKTGTPQAANRNPMEIEATYEAINEFFNGSSCECDLDQLDVMFEGFLASDSVHASNRNDRVEVFFTLKKVKKLLLLLELQKD